jgi:hypothetical protein
MADAKASQQASGDDQDTACYVYGIVPADAESNGDGRGVGEPPGRIGVIRRGEIAALVSKVHFGRPLGTPEDLTAHQKLLDAVVTAVPVLPLRFGAVMTDAQAVKDELLAHPHDEFVAALKELDGRAQYLVKGRYVEETILSEVLSELPAAEELREQLSGQPEDATRNVRIQLGEIINQAVMAKREQDTAKVVDALGPYAAMSAVREPTHELDAAQVALLVELDREDELEDAVEVLAREWEGRVNLRLLGPMAPYDFVVKGDGSP